MKISTYRIGTLVETSASGNRASGNRASGNSASGNRASINHTSGIRIICS